MPPASPTDVSALLLTLEEISRLISHSHRPEETLANIVQLIQGRFATDVCSVYLLEPEIDRMVLGATVGLRAESVGRVRMRRDEGLTGLVVERMAPVMVEDAFSHPRFKYFPEAGEDPYQTFLGVPLIEGGALQGALVVQTVERRCFSPDEVRMLVAVAAQLAPLVGEARLLDRLAAAAHEPAAPVGPLPAEATGPWQGVPLSPGLGRGEAYLIDWQHEQVPPPETTGNQVDESERLETALRAAGEELERQSRHVAELIGEDHGGILQAQLMILQDEAIRKDLRAGLMAGQTAEQAVGQVLAKYTAAFQKLASPFFRDRVYDLKDVFRRIAWHLRPRRNNQVGARLILVAPEPSVMDLFAVDLEHLAGIVVEQGGMQSHAAILARSLGIPMVGQIEPGRMTAGRPLLVDGNTGMVYPDPPAEPIVGATSCTPNEPTPWPQPRSRPSDPKLAPAPRWVPRIEANINLLSEAPRAVARGAEGVGLFRSEFVFAARRSFPTEEEQVRIYQKLLTSLDGRPITIRTFDVRGGHSAAPSSGPLDWRLVLQSPALQQVFKEQVRAILRAGASGPVRLLVPLMVRSELLDLVVATIDRAREELDEEGIAFGRQVPLGVMIEAAAAVPMVETWAGQVDFFALGTNDLTASCLGLDRDHPVGSSKEEFLHPGLFRLIRDVAEAAQRTGKPLTVCGELAATPEGTIALAALRVDALSVAVHQLPQVRRCLQTPPPASLPSQLSSARTAQEVTQILRRLLPERS